jgi:O-methyltransferase
MKVEATSRPLLERTVHAAYSQTVLRLVGDPLNRQRLKLLWFAFGYWPLLFSRAPISLGQRFKLLTAFLRIDWNILHSHTPFQVASIALTLASSRPDRGEAFVEAGCWRGGSSAKFSLLCEMLGLDLYIYDSFQGVEPMSPAPGEWDYSGEYASPETTVRANLRTFGGNAPHTLIAGWFADTLAKSPPRTPVACTYIDCDTAKGTFEALSGIIPALAPNGVVFSQDCHIAPVIALLTSPETWERLGVPVPTMTRHDWRLVELNWHGRN